MSFAALTASSASFLAAAAPARFAVRCSVQPASNSASLSVKTPVNSEDTLLSAFVTPALTWGTPSSSALIPEVTLDPSAAYANLMFAAANKTFNTQILVGETESTESVVRRFKKVCMDANIVNECRRRRYFETKQDIVKRKQKDAARKRKRFQRSNGPRPNFYASKDKAEPEKSAAPEEDDDAEWDAMSL